MEQGLNIVAGKTPCPAITVSNAGRARSAAGGGRRVGGEIPGRGDAHQGGDGVRPALGQGDRQCPPMQ